MSKDKSSLPEHHPKPLTEDRGLQPAKNPPAMPQVKPPKSEKSS